MPTRKMPTKPTRITNANEITMPTRISNATRIANATRINQCQRKKPKITKITKANESKVKIPTKNEGKNSSQKMEQRKKEVNYNKE